MTGPNYPIGAIHNGAKRARIVSYRSIQRMQALNPERSAEDIENVARAELARLTPNDFCMRWQENNSPNMDVYGIECDGIGIYLKVYIEKRAVKIASFHPPDDVLTTIAGRTLRPQKASNK